MYIYIYICSYIYIYDSVFFLGVRTKPLYSAVEECSYGAP